MKKTLTTLFVIAFVFAAISTAAKAELLTDLYGINIKDASSSDDKQLNLYGLVNSYFGDQLGTEGLYKSSNALFNDRGVDPNMIWTTDNSELSGAFKVAGYGHTLNLLHDGTSMKTMEYLPNTADAKVSGITDLSKYSLTGLNTFDISNITNGIWELEVHQKNNSDISYSLYSSAGLNSDGLIHMIAFDITDLYNLKFFGEDRKDEWVNTAYMFAWEDILGKNGPDWDFQDFVGIVTNIKSGSADSYGNPTTPEPATLAVLGLGLGLLPITRRFTKKSK